MKEKMQVGELSHNQVTREVKAKIRISDPKKKIHISVRNLFQGFGLILALYNDYLTSEITVMLPFFPGPLP